MSFLTGYPAAWLVTCIIFGVYALFSRRCVLATVGACAALAFSLLLSMAQLLPAVEARSVIVLEEKYGAGAYGFRTLGNTAAFIPFILSADHGGCRRSSFANPPLQLIRAVVFASTTDLGARWAVSDRDAVRNQTAIALLLFSFAIWCVRQSSGRRRILLAAALLFAVVGGLQ
jgi:hypothetical protein